MKILGIREILGKQFRTDYLAVPDDQGTVCLMWKKYLSDSPYD
jgi:hypothetical protein